MFPDFLVVHPQSAILSQIHLPDIILGQCIVFPLSHEVIFSQMVHIYSTRLKKKTLTFVRTKWLDLNQTGEEL